MLRKTLMLGLVAGFLALGGCDWCNDCDDAAVTDGAALQADDCGDACAECLDGCDDAAAAGDLAADAVAGDAADLACPVSGTTGSGACGAAEKTDCDDAAAGCEIEEPDCETQCETSCDEKPAAPKVSD